MIFNPYKKRSLEAALKLAYEEGYIHEEEIPGCFGTVADHLFRCNECPLYPNCEEEHERTLGGEC